jgi:hypothetical protein
MQTYVFALTPGCTRIAHTIYCQSYVGAKSVPAWSLLDQLQVLMPDDSEKCLSGLAWPSGYSALSTMRRLKARRSSQDTGVQLRSLLFFRDKNHLMAMIRVYCF